MDRKYKIHSFKMPMFELYPSFIDDGYNFVKFTELDDQLCKMYSNVKESIIGNAPKGYCYNTDHNVMFNIKTSSYHSIFVQVRYVEDDDTYNTRVRNEEIEKSIREGKKHAKQVAEEDIKRFEFEKNIHGIKKFLDKHGYEVVKKD